MSSTDSLLHSLYVMASMVEARDPYTGGHLWRVSQFSGLLADALGLPSPDRGRIVLGGFLHDLGKVGVPDAILNKPDRLTEDEYAVIRTHPHVGSRILTNHPLEPLVVSAILSHHEMPSGKGYPHGLMAGQISVDARIVGLCDAFDAMTSTRPIVRACRLPKRSILSARISAVSLMPTSVANSSRSDKRALWIQLLAIATSACRYSIVQPAGQPL